MTIRPMESRDLDSVASLYQQEMRGGGVAPDGLREWFRRVVLDHPWGDPEIPSLVAEEDGSISGFLASHVRRLTIDGEPGRLACSGPLVVDSTARRMATGAVLLRKYLDGPQDLTITDGATELVRAIWERLGGEPAHPQSIEWIKPLRPGAIGAALWGRRRGRTHLGNLGTAIGRLGDSAAAIPQVRRLLEGGRDVDHAYIAQEFEVEPMTGESLAAATATVAARRRLYPAYDEVFADWLLRELAAAGSRGELRARLVRPSGRDEPVGWFAYYLQRNGISQVVSIGAADERGAGVLLDALLADARGCGAAAVRGRLEPLLVAPAGKRKCLFRYAGQALVHARDPSVTALASSRHSLLTRMEGEWWMDPHLL